MSNGAVILQGNFPIPDDRKQLLAQLATELNREQLLWLAGYFAGAAAATPSGNPAYQESLPGAQMQRVAHGNVAPFAPVAPQAAAAAAASPTLTIISASHTGNGRKISEKLLAAVQAAGVQARVVKAGDYQPREIAKEKLLYVVISTHGDGDPPDEARGLYEFLGTKRAPQLPDLMYSVLALGDSSYPKFCEAGRVVDERLAKLGAKRLLPRVDCDVDFEKLAQTWADDALARVREHADKFKPAGGNVAAFAPAPVAAAAPQMAELKREAPATAEVLANQRIVGRGALRDVRHVELSFSGLGNLYKPGDALGIVHTNPESAIDAVLKATKLDGSATVALDGKTHTLHEWLRDERELTRIARPLLVQVAKQAAVDISELLGNADAMAKLTSTCQVSDILAAYPAEWTAETLVSALRPVTGRVYSIASSPAAVGDEVHLTVAVVGSDTDRKLLPGAASHFVINTPADSQVKVWIERNDRFRVPADGSRDIIMVGPGTGIAPFRGFQQEREATGATGRNWLFFGGRSLYHDFLYQLEWQQALKRKSLHRIDVAFSRDQAEKIYVQHRIKQAGKELFAWLSNGAYFYVCGDATSMAPDVNAALLEVVSTHGNMDADDAQAWLADLTADGRYLRDVY
jgi:sulfite reductase (NADPH) flavoprotein alpha-component